MKICETHAVQLCTHMEKSNTSIPLPLLEEGILFHNKQRTLESVNELIRKIDSDNSAKQYLEVKFAPHHHLIDTEARKLQLHEHVLSTIKCVTGFNHYAIREKMFNSHKSDRCDLCGARESWSHILQCRGNYEKMTGFYKN